MVGAIFMDFQQSLVAASVLMLTQMLLGGFYVHNLPFWLEWAQYMSYVSYSFRATLEFAFLDINLRWGIDSTIGTHFDVRCYRCLPEDIDEYQFCNTTLFNATISGDQVLTAEGGQYPFSWYISLFVIVGYGILFRVVAYLALRFLHRKDK